MKFAFPMLICASLLLSGCIDPVPVPGVPGGDPGGNCGAEELQSLVGQPGVVLNGMRFRQDVRIVEFGMAVTMDFNPERLNIWLDRRDVIERVTCG